MLQQLELDKYKRIHYLPSPRSLDEASEFIANTLLLSHGIRKDTLSIVELRCCTLIAPGDKLRQLRPDYETRMGWIKAVLRGKYRGLGAVLDPDRSISSSLEEVSGVALVALYYGSRSLLNVQAIDIIKNKKETILINYLLAEDKDATHRIDFETPYSPGITGAVINIFLDNILASEKS